jgi:kojibiose phosphorylase
LSAAIHALVAARLGDMEKAQVYFHQAAEIDLSNNMGNAAGGVHAAALGGLWQAVVFGFAGMSLRPDGLDFDPHCPPEWGAIDFPVTWRGRQLHVHITPDRLDVRLVSGAPMRIAAGEPPARSIAVQSTVHWIKQADHQWRPV